MKVIVSCSPTAIWQLFKIYIQFVVVDYIQHRKAANPHIGVSIHFNLSIDLIVLALDSSDPRPYSHANIDKSATYIVCMFLKKKILADATYLLCDKWVLITKK